MGNLPLPAYFFCLKIIVFAALYSRCVLEINVRGSDELTV